MKKEEVETVDEAVYGGTPKKTEDKRMTVTNADKKANTPAYQRFKAGDKRYKAADHMKEHHQKDENGNTIPHPIKEAFYFSDEEIADMVEIDEATDQELISSLKRLKNSLLTRKIFLKSVSTLKVLKLSLR
jgi:hypothetical protein